MATTVESPTTGGLSFELSDELKSLQQTVREYVRSRLEPIGQQVEKEDRIPSEVIKEMGELGFFGVPFPEKYGGLGLGELGYCVELEQLGFANAAYSNLVGAAVGLFGTAVYLDGSEEQKERYLRPIAEGRAIGSFCLTEPMSGSDAASLRTTATRRDGGWELNGSKQWVTNSPIADFFVVFAANDRSKGSRGISAFIVEKGTPGFTVGKPDEKMGLHGSHTAPVSIEGVFVPDAQVVGEIGAGFKTALKTLDGGRISLAAGAVGTAQWLLERSIAYARQREQFGKAIASFEAIQWMLADMQVGVHAGRLMVYQAAWKMDRGQRATREAGICKLFCSEMVNRVADLAVQLHGGMGYMRELPIERAYRDARILRIYEGTNEVQRMVIAEDLLRE